MSSSVTWKQGFHLKPVTDSGAVRPQIFIDIRVIGLHMARIAVTDGLDSSAVKQLRTLGHEVVENHFSSDELLSGALNGFDAVIVRSATKMTASVIRASSGLSFIGRGGVGVDNIDITVASENDIVVCNTPRASTHSVVELTIGHLLASCRHIPSGDRGLRDGLWEKKSLKGTELAGKRLGFIGFGRIAQGVAKIALAFGMELHAYDPYLPAEIARQNNCTLHSDVNAIFRL